MKTWEKHGLHPNEFLVLLIFTKEHGALACDQNGNHKKLSWEDGIEMTVEAAQANLVKFWDPEWKVPSNLIGCPKVAEAYFFGEKKTMSLGEIISQIF